MKGERKKFGMVLIFFVLFITLAFVSVGCASATTDTVRSSLAPDEPVELTISEFWDMSDSERQNFVGKKVKIQGAVYRNGRQEILAMQQIEIPILIIEFAGTTIRKSLEEAITLLGLSVGAKIMYLDFISDIISIFKGGASLLTNQCIEGTRLLSGNMYIIGTASNDFLGSDGKPLSIIVYPEIKKGALWASEGSEVEFTGTLMYGPPASNWFYNWFTKEFKTVLTDIYWIEPEKLTILEEGIPPSVYDKVGEELFLVGLFFIDSEGGFMDYSGPLVKTSHYNVYLKNLPASFSVDENLPVKVEGKIVKIDYDEDNYRYFLLLDVSDIDTVLEGIFNIATSSQKETYFPGETAKVIVEITNERSETTELWVGATFKNPEGIEYDIPLIPTTIATNEVKSFDIEWAIPEDASTGEYEIAVNCWKDEAQTDRYSDNLDWTKIFSVSSASEALDLIFVIDTTGSMWDDIGNVKSSATDIVEAIDNEVSDYRVAVVDYRDHPVYPYGASGDYPYNAVLSFSTDKTEIVNAIQSLSLGNGLDWDESVYSALIRAINTENLGAWRDGVEKVVIIMGDAPPHDPEPITGYVLDDVIEAAENVDPAIIYCIAIGGDSTAYSYFVSLAESTGGNVYTALTAADVVEAILEAVGDIGEPSNHPPDCSWAKASVTELWPPNHKLVPIAILNVEDPDGDYVSITITEISQDEPVSGLNDEDEALDEAPDGLGIGLDTAMLRAERWDEGDGRVYKISFVATDEKGGESSGCVLVGVPHDLGENTIIIDSGQLYDSTMDS